MLGGWEPLHRNKLGQSEWFGGRRGYKAVTHEERPLQTAWLLLSIFVVFAKASNSLISNRQSLSHAHTEIILCAGSGVAVSFN